MPWRSPLLVWNQSVVPCPVLTVASWLVYRFLRRQVRWPVIPISSRVFHSLLWSTKGFSIVNETEVNVFPEFPYFIYDPASVGYLISGSSAFSKPSLDIWKFSVHIMLKPGLEDFEHDLTNMGYECSCPVVWTFFNTALLGNWDEDRPFPVLWVFQICWHIECSTLIASSFKILNSSAGIP